MIKMIPSGLKIDESREEEKSLEHQAEETELYKSAGNIAIRLWFGSCSLLLSNNINVLPCQWVMSGVHHPLIQIFSNYTKKQKNTFFQMGNFQSLFQLLLTFKQIYQQRQLIQQKSSWSQTQSGHRHQQSDSWCWLWISPFEFIRRNTTNARFYIIFPVPLPGEFWGDEQGEQRGEKL